MKNQRERARAARGDSSYMGNDDGILNKIPAEIETAFSGYDKLVDSSEVKVLIKDNEFVGTLAVNEKKV